MGGSEAEEPALSQFVVGREYSQQAIVNEGLQINLYPPEGKQGGTGSPMPAASRQSRRAWNLDARNPRFTGRSALLDRIHESLGTGHATVIQALSGMGGVGKTQLALEYAHRHAEDHDVAWWINAEREELIDPQFQALAMALGLIKPDAGLPVAVNAVRAWLNEHDGWLIVFDNAKNAEQLRGRLPSGRGRVLITSRSRRWKEFANPIDVDVLERGDAVRLLQGHSSDLDRREAAELAAALGDLPLALVQAADFIEESGTDPRDYLSLLQLHAQELLDAGRSAAYPSTMAAAMTISCDELRAADPLAFTMLKMCAFMAPEPIPTQVLTGRLDRPGPPEASGGAGPPRDPVPARRSLARITEYGLAKIERSGLRMHRLTRSFVQNHPGGPDGAATMALLQEALVQAHPGKATDPGSWAPWALLVPHLLVARPEHSPNSAFRGMIREAAFYLISMGQAHLAEKWLGELTDGWTRRLGADHTDTLGARHLLALALRHRGRAEEARELNEDTLSKRRRLFGENHSAALGTANNLGKDLLALGRADEAREILEDTLRRRRELQGDDHLETLNVAHNLASSLHMLGEFTDARNINEFVLERRIIIFGDLHFHTLYSMNNLAEDLLAMKRFDEALSLFRKAYDGRSKVMGSDHPETLESGSGLARALFLSGQIQAGASMNEDVLARRRRVLGDSHPDTLRSLRNLEQ